MIELYLKKVIDRKDLSEAEMQYIMENIMEGKVPEILTGAFLTALSMKGETVEEITAAARVMRNLAEKISIEDDVLIDTCGTGGDESGTFNVSTGVAFVLAAAGVTVVKHGNRSVTSKCGSADVLEALGAKIDLTPRQTEEIINKIKMGFLFAPSFHKAMKYAAPVRKTLAIKTIFNVLGPVTNPGCANHQVVGVFKEDLTEQIAEVLQKLGSRHVMVVHGLECLDEISITGETKVSELKNGQIRTYYIRPEDFGLKSGQMKDISGGEAEENAAILRDIFEGAQGTKRDFLLINSGAALYVSGKAGNISEGIRLASELIDSGKVLAKLREYVDCTNKIQNNEEAS